MTKAAVTLATALVACTSHTTPPAKTANSKPAAAEPRAEDILYECKQAEGDIQTAFGPGVTLAQLVAWAEAFTCKHFVYRTCLANERLNLSTSARTMSPPEAWDLFVSSVETLGLTAKLHGDTVSLAGDAPCPKVAKVVEPAPQPVTYARADDDDPLDLEHRILQVSDLEYQIERSLVDDILSDPMKIARGARIVPSVKNGKEDGLKLYAIRPSSIYAHLGLRNGDTIHSINNMDLSTPDKALEIYQKLKAADSLVLSITRRGKPLSLVWVIH